MEEKKHEHHAEHYAHKKSLNIKKNDLWKSASTILAILLVISVFFNIKGTNSGGAVLSPNEVGNNAVDFINTNLLQEGSTATLLSVSEENGLYNVKLDVDGKPFNSYATKDGSLLFPSSVDMAATTSTPSEPEVPADLEKSDNPTAELYIFSYCPAGISTLDSFAEAGKLLKDAADIKVKFFSDMHGEYEKQQNIIQACIQDVESDKYWDYAIDFFEKVYSVCASTRDAECDMTESVKLMDEVGIDSDAVFACVDEKGESLYENDKKDAGALSLRYSPSIVINGVYLGNTDRSPEGIKATICGAFNEEPEECSEELGEAGTQSVGSCN